MPRTRARHKLLHGADVVLQAYRPGARRAGAGPAAAARARPGIVYVSLSAYGHAGPWAGRRGFDSLVQTATGFNHAEAEAGGGGRRGRCRRRYWTMPPATCWPSARWRRCGAAPRKAAAGTCGCRWRRWGSGCAAWAGFRKAAAPEQRFEDIGDLLMTLPSGFGELTVVRHAGQLAQTPRAGCCRRCRSARMPPSGCRAADARYGARRKDAANTPQARRNHAASTPRRTERDGFSTACRAGAPAVPRRRRGRRCRRG